MANVLINEDTMTSIADSIRAKNGTSAGLNPADMAAAIDNLPSGGTIEISGFGSVRRSADAECRENIPTGANPTSDGASLSVGDYIVMQVTVTGTGLCRPTIKFGSFFDSDSELGVEFVKQVSITTNINGSGTNEHGTAGHCFLFKVIKNNPDGFGVTYNFTSNGTKEVPTTYSYNNFYIRQTTEEE